MPEGLSCRSDGRTLGFRDAAEFVEDAEAEVGCEMRRFLEADSSVVKSVVVEALFRSFWATRDVLETLEMESSILLNLRFVVVSANDMFRRL